MGRLIKLYVISIFTLVNILYSQTFNLDPSVLQETSIGPRASGMGNAYTAIADDATALGWNPAGLATLNKARGAISSTVHFGNLDIDPPETVNPENIYSGNKGEGFNINYVGFALPISLEKTKFVGSIIVRNLADLNDKITYLTEIPEEDICIDSTHKSSGGIYALSVGAGIKIVNSILLGMSLNVVSGKEELNEQLHIQTKSDSSVEWSQWDNKFSGMNFDFGFLWQASRSLSIGSKITFPHTINLTDIHFSDSNGTDREYEFDSYIKKPLVVSYGLAFKPSPNILFCLDYLRRPWQKIKIKVDSDEIDGYFDASNSLRLGFEYSIFSKDCLVPLRLGYYTNPEQLNDYNVNKPQYKGDQVTSHYVTSGFGLTSKNFTGNLSIAYQILKFEKDAGIKSSTFSIRQSRFLVTFGLEIMI